MDPIATNPSPGSRIEIRRAARQLWVDGRVARLGARAFDVLCALYERRDRLVTKNELLDVVWPGVVVAENNLQVQISTLRRLLGPAAITTIPGRGYQLAVGERIDRSAAGGRTRDDVPAAPSAPAAPRAVPSVGNVRDELPALFGRDGEALRTPLSGDGQPAAALGRLPLSVLRRMAAALQHRRGPNRESPLEHIENRTFDEIEIGDTATLVRTLTEQDITLFAVMSGDINPAHVDPEYAKSSRFREVIGHGMWSGALISTVLGTEFPGPGTIYLGQNLRFRRPVKVGDTITIQVTATEKDAEKGKVVLDTECRNQDDEIVVSGTAEVIAPKEKVRRQRIDLPLVRFDDKEARFREVMGRVRARELAPVATAIVNPVDANSLASIAAAAKTGSIVPILVGAESAIREVAEEGGVDIGAFQVVPAASPRETVAESIRLAREGRVEGIMQCCVATEDLIVPVISSAKGLRTERRVSHVHVMDVPTYPKPLFITDSMINIAPGLSEKRDICQNVIDLAHWLGIPAPKVAVLAAVDTINPKMPATIEAATLCKMAERGQIGGGILDGPLTFDHAVSLTAAENTGIRSPVAGQADVLLVPDLESGNMIAKQLMYLADALSAGIVLGARVPIALTGRGDDRRSWLASAVLVQLVAHMYRMTAAGTAAGR